VKRFLMVVAVAALAAGPASALPRVVHFRTPSGNVQCAYLAGNGFHRELRCEIRGGIRPLPARPKDCVGDWGGGYDLTPRGRAEILCVGDTIQVQHSRVLGYGKAWRAGAFSCLSQKVGLRCQNRVGHGFFLSRSRSYTFS
jgi:hypothetical protein